MRDSQIIRNLQGEVKIPQIVQEKAEWAFAQIREERGGDKKMDKRSVRLKTMRIAAACATLVFGTVTVCAAAYIHWSSGMEAEFSATEEQKIYLEQQEMAAPLYESDMQENITVTAQQSIVDRHFAHLSFKVEGYDLQEGLEPAFEDIRIFVDGSSDFSWSGRFFNGWMMDDNGNTAYADGRPWDEDAVEVFVDEDGSMEFDLTINGGETAGRLIGAPIHLEFENLGTVHKAVYTPDVTGIWTLDFTLQGSDAIRTATLSKELGTSGCIVTEAEISPISLDVTYKMPVVLEDIEGVDENGAPVVAHAYQEPPSLAGVRLTDGTMLPYITNGGSEGFEDLENGIYKATFAVNRILDTEQVDALLFIKSSPAGEETLKEENLYIVPLN